MSSRSSPITIRMEHTVKFLQKRVEIDAVHFTGSGDSCDEVTEFLGGAQDASTHRWKARTNDGGFILTPGDEIEFCVGDWIIRGVGGEVYPVKPDIFTAVYEAKES